MCESADWEIMMYQMLGVLIASFSFSACLFFPTPGPIKPVAAADLHCLEAEISHKSLQPFVESVAGCGRENVYYWSGTAWVSPLGRASFDLDCAREDLKAKQLDPTSVGVSGCGKKAVYVAVQGSGWVVNNSPK